MKVEDVDSFVIRNIETLELFKADSGKTSWSKVSAAKNAWKRSTYNVPKELQVEDSYYKTKVVRFDDQDEFEIVSMKQFSLKVESNINTSVDEVTKAYNEALTYALDSGLDYYDTVGFLRLWREGSWTEIKDWYPDFDLTSILKVQ